jgi:hypothetical protein
MMLFPKMLSIKNFLFLVYKHHHMTSSPIGNKYKISWRNLLLFQKKSMPNFWSSLPLLFAHLTHKSTNSCYQVGLEVLIAVKMSILVLLPISTGLLITLQLKMYNESTFFWLLHLKLHPFYYWNMISQTWVLAQALILLMFMDSDGYSLKFGMLLKSD